MPTVTSGACEISQRRSGLPPVPVRFTVRLFAVPDVVSAPPLAPLPQSYGGTAVSICLYVEDVDAVFNQGVAAGAKPIMPVQDMFWGDRYGMQIDPFGHQWGIATHKEDLSPQEMEKRMKESFAAMGKK